MLKTVSSTINAIGALNFKGTWDAATNTPALASSVGVKGDYYYVSVAGNTNLNGITDWQVTDLAVFNGSVWQKIDNTDQVLSVNGQVGVVVLTAANVGAAANTVNVIAGTGLGGGGNLEANVNVFLANTAVTAATYGDAATVAVFTVDAQGRLTAASNATIAIANTQVSGLGTMSTQNANNVAITGGTINVANVTATTSFFGANYQATGSAGGTLKNSSGTPQFQWGSGGGNNLSLEVATNINPANAAVSISPTGTGTVTINPAGGGSANLSSITAANVSVTANLFANLATSNSAAMPDPSLPLNPEGYLSVVINGATKKIPYYGV